MVSLYQLLPTIAHMLEGANNVKHVAEACIQASSRATKIDDSKKEAITRFSKNANDALTLAINNLKAVSDTINDAWDAFREKYPVIPAQYFVFDDDGEAHETDRATFDKIPKPIENYHVDVRDFDNYEDIPGADIVVRAR